LNLYRYIWASGAEGSFSISEDEQGEPLGRGTLLRIHLKDEALEYLQDDKLKSLVEKYSEFINFPIYLQVEKVRRTVVENVADPAPLILKLRGEGSL
jgi:heat shock protein beta